MQNAHRKAVDNSMVANRRSVASILRRKAAADEEKDYNCRLTSRAIFPLTTSRGLLHEALHVAHHHPLHVGVFLVILGQFKQRGIGFVLLDVAEGRRRGFPLVDGLILSRKIL